MEGTNFISSSGSDLMQISDPVLTFAAGVGSSTVVRKGLGQIESR